MSGLVGVVASLQNTIVDTFSLGSAYGPPALAGALGLSALYYVDRRRRRGRAPSLKGFLRSTFPRRIVLHPSSVVDMWMWLWNGILLSSAYGLVSFGLFYWRDKFVAGFTAVLGAHQPTHWPTWLVFALATILQVLAFELAYWFGHYLFHRIPALWEFHKVHHSAEVMTTFTELRQHPVEILAFVNLIGLATGFVFGAMGYAFGPNVAPFTLFSGNVLIITFLITWGHLRHSHMWIPVQGLAGKLLQSPAHHQLHHSDNPAHWDKNLGFALAVYDWAFGTLVIPDRERMPIVFGVGADNPQFRSALGNYLTPFVRFGEEVGKALGAHEPHAPPAVAPPR